MNFELNDLTGSSLPSIGDSAPTTASNHPPPDQRHETNATMGPASRVQPNAKMDIKPKPTAASFATTLTYRSFDSSTSPTFGLGADSASPGQSLRAPSLHDIVEVGYSTDEMTSTAYKAILSAISAFGLVMNNMPARDITMPMAYGYIEHLLACGLSWWRVTQDLVVLSSVVRRGKQLGLLPSDLLCVFDAYAHGMLKRTPVPAISNPFRAADLQRLFSSDLYQSGHPDPLDSKAGRFWTPLVALFTGARPGELGCAQVSDIEFHETVWMLRVPPSRAAARPASPGDSRLIPLHPELVRCGFIRYAAQRKLAGETTLFPVNAGGAATTQAPAALSHWFSRYAKNNGLRPELRTLRAFRSTFVLACILSGMDGATCAELASMTGHRQPPSGETQSELTPGHLAAFHFYWVRQLRFQGLVLSHLYTRDPLAGAEGAFLTSAVA